MSNVRRVYVEKKEAFAGAAKDLTAEIQGYLGIKNVARVRILIRYDVENISDEVFERACKTVFSEPPVDLLYREEFPHEAEDRVFAVEYLPGQFDQRADSAEQCVRFLKEDEDPIIRSAKVYVISGAISDAQEEAIRSYCINPVDSRVAAAGKPDTLTSVFDEPEDIAVFEGFTGMSEEELHGLYDSLKNAEESMQFYIQAEKEKYRHEKHDNCSSLFF